MYFLSLDPGGTKCEAVLTDENANILNYYKSNHTLKEIAKIFAEKPYISRYGIGRSTDVIKETLNEITKNINKNEKISLVACSMPSNIIPLINELKLNVENNFYTSEFEYAMKAEFIETGYMALAGTGALCFYGNSNNSFCIDGLGPNIGDFGGGCYIGKKAIKASAKSQWHPDYYTSLGEKINEIFLNKKDNNNGLDLIRVFSEKPERSVIASLSKTVNEEAEKGDRISVEILEEAAWQISETLRCLAYLTETENEEYPVVCTGSIMVKSDIYFNAFKNNVRKFLPKADIRRISLPPCFGGIMYIINKLNIPDKYEYYCKLKENAKKSKIV